MLKKLLLCLAIASVYYDNCYQVSAMEYSDESDHESDSKDSISKKIESIYSNDKEKKYKLYKLKAELVSSYGIKDDEDSFLNTNILSSILEIDDINRLEQIVTKYDKLKQLFQIDSSIKSLFDMMIYYMNPNEVFSLCRRIYNGCHEIKLSEEDSKKFYGSKTLYEAIMITLIKKRILYYKYYFITGHRDYLFTNGDGKNTIKTLLKLRFWNNDDIKIISELMTPLNNLLVKEDIYIYDYDIDGWSNAYFLSMKKTGKDKYDLIIEDKSFDTFNPSHYSILNNKEGYVKIYNHNNILAYSNENNDIKNNINYDKAVDSLFNYYVDDDDESNIINIFGLSRPFRQIHSLLICDYSVFSKLLDKIQSSDKSSNDKLAIFKWLLKIYKYQETKAREEFPISSFGADEHIYSNIDNMKVFVELQDRLIETYLKVQKDINAQINKLGNVEDIVSSSKINEIEESDNESDNKPEHESDEESENESDNKSEHESGNGSDSESNNKIIESDFNKNDEESIINAINHNNQFDITIISNKIKEDLKFLDKLKFGIKDKEKYTNLLCLLLDYYNNDNMNDKQNITIRSEIQKRIFAALE